jgi:hypothetical protein
MAATRRADCNDGVDRIVHPGAGQELARALRQLGVQRFKVGVCEQARAACTRLLGGVELSSCGIRVQPSHPPIGASRTDALRRSARPHVDVEHLDCVVSVTEAVPRRNIGLDVARRVGRARS